MRINDVKTDPRGIVMIIERKGLLTHSWNIQGVFILDRRYYSLSNVYRAYCNMILDMYEFLYLCWIIGIVFQTDLLIQN